ncbi:monovalent cation/H(+) antiporter subunit G [Nesterenkonia pannonica]|uniref:cation:proton antiporter n=1 Tax=Nesterenkonia pannonica TaxID=1548602 RepID=UPI0021643791|nr:monovalent cation/H(+) antiporter subunit G [Nesterenkonia pannonica]
MSVAADLFGLALVVVGALFFTAGTVGLLRFPDVRSQLHALTKADNLGLGLMLARCRPAGQRHRRRGGPADLAAGARGRIGVGARSGRRRG